jgi:hypothetical protein
MKRLGGFILLAGLVVGFLSCSKSNQANLKVYLTDAPGNFEKVMIDIQAVEVHVGTDQSETGWKTLDTFSPAIFNLLDFSNGLDTLLGAIQLPAGEISQIRLTLGTGNSVTLNGETYPLTVPSGSTSGLKLNLHANLVDGITYKLWLDFDAGRSIVETGNHLFKLKPVIRTFADATSGAIKGTISPAESKPYIMAIANSDTLGTIADTLGGFLIKGVPTGAYKMVFVPIEGYNEKSIDNVTVTLGEVNNLGTITIDTATK